MESLPIHRSRWLPALAGGYAVKAVAAPIEGELSSNAAALLMLLGLGALLMGLRNLRELRHKRLTPDRRHAGQGNNADDADGQ